MAARPKLKKKKPSPLDEYQQRLRIDKDDLDGDVSRQPAMFYFVASKCARALSIRDAAKDALKVEYANADARVRNAFEDSGEKITEAKVKAGVESDEEYVAAVRDYRDTALEASEWEALKEAWMQRSYALKDLVQLYVASYFESDAGRVGVQAARDAKEASDTRAKQSAARRRKRV